MNYNEFAYIYDDIIDVDYKRWVNYLEDIFKKNEISPKLILELACGTGNITIEMSNRGYDLIGLDKSSDMLSVAKQKALSQGKDILFLNQDMREFELYGSVDAIICMMDGINYLTDPNDVSKVFDIANYYLNPDGLFIFDIRTEYALSNIISNNIFVEDEEDVTYIWQNEYDNINKISNMFLTFFVKNNNAYNKFSECHSLKCYSINEISKKLENSNFQLLNVYDNLCFDEAKKHSERVFFISRKK